MDRRKPAGKKSAKKKSAKRKPVGARAKSRDIRLAADLRPSSVDLHVEVDPERTDAFRGEVAIDLHGEERRSSIELHAVDLRVTRARLEIDGEQRAGRVIPHPERQTVEIAFDRPVPAGRVRLSLAFAGKLRGDLCGLYAARSGAHRYAFTQLEAAEARKFFPCFDEPAMKARFRLSVTTSASNTVVSNSPVERNEEHADGRKTVHFARTPRLSSYLVALAVGVLECSEAVHAGPTEIRVWHAPGKGGLTAFALEAARETLVRLEQYFDLPYPYAKLDLVAVPDFEFGAMENAGAVFFRETVLLTEPSTVTVAEQKRVAEVICHELAHMWYGNLVTMAWWDDLWLNEAFATWMAFHVVDQWKPDWKMWQDFQHHRAAALGLDALHNTHPIYTPVRTPDEANENFDLITYEKGASVVRMVERFLGPVPFRDGVRRYIRRHRESNAVAADLWHALSAASGEKVEPVVRAWIEQEGYPVVVVRRIEKDGFAEIELAQERFFERPPRTRSRTRWPIPWVGRIGTGEKLGSRLERRLLTAARTRIPAHGADLTFVYGNADEGGFFRPQHGETELRDLIDDLASLATVERIGFVDHQWALVRAGRCSLASLLDLCAVLGADPDPDVLTAVRAPLASLTQRLAPDAASDTALRMRAWIEVYFGGQFDELGWDPKPEESEENRLRRAAIFSIVGDLAEASSLLKTSRERCSAYLEDRGSLDPNLADVVVTIAASQGDEALFERFFAAMRDARTPQDQRRFLLSLADFREPGLIARMLDLTLGDEVATQDVVFLLARAFANRDARERTWSFVKRRWPALRRRMPPLLASRLISATPVLGTRAHRQDVARFFRDHPIPSGARALKQALERFDWYQEFRRRAAPQLDSYLRG